MAKEPLAADIHYAVVSFSCFLMVGITWAWIALGFHPVILLVVFGAGAARRFWTAWQ